jgi:talin
MNRSGNATSPSPSHFQNQVNSTTYEQQQQINQQIITQQKRSNLLTANAVPKPYNSSILSSGSPSPQPPPLQQPISPIQNRTYETTTITNPNLSTRFDKSRLEQCVQDLHEKTFGKNSPVNTLSTFKTTVTTNVAPPNDGKQNYEGYTTR